MKRTVSDIGERGIIDLFHKIFEEMPDLPIPFGDDVSAVNCRDDLAVVKSDMLVGKTDVPKGMSLRQVGRKAVVSTVSDFASKGVQPTALMVSIGLPRKYSLAELKKLAEGLNEGAREYSTYLIGGDTNEADDIIVDCIGIGFAKRGRIMLRGGAQPGDILASTGDFGETSAGLRMLTKKIALPLKTVQHLEEAVYNPRAHLKEGLILAETEKVSSCIDSSDGLSNSLHEISRYSNVGFYITNVPIAGTALEFADKAGVKPLDLALHGGEEFNLIFTLDKMDWKEVKNTVLNAGGNIHFLGEVIEENKIFLEVQNERREIKPLGWEHLRRTKT